MNYLCSLIHTLPQLRLTHLLINTCLLNSPSNLCRHFLQGRCLSPLVQFACIQQGFILFVASLLQFLDSLNLSSRSSCGVNRFGITSFTSRLRTLVDNRFGITSSRSWVIGPLGLLGIFSAFQSLTHYFSFATNDVHNKKFHLRWRRQKWELRCLHTKQNRKYRQPVLERTDTLRLFLNSGFTSIIKTLISSRL